MSLTKEREQEIRKLITDLLLEELKKLRAENGKLMVALRFIATESCCDSRIPLCCNTFAVKAQKALEQDEEGK